MFARHILVLGLITSALCGCVQDQQRPLTLNSILESPQLDGFSGADKVVPIQFPRDHGEHRDFQTEWWYLVGIVRDNVGRPFGFQFTLFRQALKPNHKDLNPWRSGHLYMAHMAISDVQREKHSSFERISRGHESLAFVQTQPFKVVLEDWQLYSTEDSFAPLQLEAQDGEFGLNLSLEVTKPPVLHGNQGLSSKSPQNASYYYSIPRLSASGTLTSPEGEFTVTGNAWMDREWSTGILDKHYGGWNWLSLSFVGGEDLVLFNLVPVDPKTPVFPVGMLVDSKGQKSNLNVDDWRMSPIRFWRGWPLDWELEIDGRKISIEAAYDNQLMTTSIRYWEGVVFAFENQQQVGEGYLELTGY